MFFNRAGKNIRMDGLYANQSAFLITSPCLLSEEVKLLLHGRGILVVAINQAVEYLRPNIWILTQMTSEDALKYNDPGLIRFVTDRIELKDEICASYFRYLNDNISLNEKLYMNTLKLWPFESMDPMTIASVGFSISLLKELGIIRVFLIGDYKLSAVNALKQSMTADLDALENSWGVEHELLCIQLANGGSSDSQVITLADALSVTKGKYFADLNTSSMYDRMQRMKDSLKMTQSKIPVPVKIKVNPVIR